jgi:hypothetical protein
MGQALTQMRGDIEGVLVESAEAEATAAQWLDNVACMNAKLNRMPKPNLWTIPTTPPNQTTMRESAARETKR